MGDGLRGRHHAALTSGTTSAVRRRASYFFARRARFDRARPHKKLKRARASTAKVAGAHVTCVTFGLAVTSRSLDLPGHMKAVPTKKASKERVKTVSDSNVLEQHFKTNQSDLTFEDFCSLIREEESGVTDAALKVRYEKFDMDVNGSISKREWRTERLSRTILTELADLSRGGSLADLFTQWNEKHKGDDSASRYQNTLDKIQFRNALRSLKTKSIARCTDEELDGVYAALDRDHSGSLTFQEINAELQRLRPGASKSSGTALDAGFALKQEGDPIHQLKVAVSTRLEKVINLFREWDKDGDGNITKVEFSRALTLLSFEGSKETVEALFDMIDLNGNGVIEFKELRKALSGVRGTPKLELFVPQPAALPSTPPVCSRCSEIDEERALLQELLKEAEEARDSADAAKAALAKQLAELHDRCDQAESERAAAEKLTSKTVEDGAADRTALEARNSISVEALKDSQNQLSELRVRLQRTEEERGAAEAASKKAEEATRKQAEDAAAGQERLVETHKMELAAEKQTLVEAHRAELAGLNAQREAEQAATQEAQRAAEAAAQEAQQTAEAVARQQAQESAKILEDLSMTHQSEIDRLEAQRAAIEANANQMRIEADATTKAHEQDLLALKERMAEEHRLELSRIASERAKHNAQLREAEAIAESQRMATAAANKAEQDQLVAELKASLAKQKLELEDRLARETALLETRLRDAEAAKSAAIESLHQTEAAAAKKSAEDKLAAAEKEAKAARMAAERYEAEEKRRADVESELKRANHRAAELANQLKESQDQCGAGEDRRDRQADAHRNELARLAAERAAVEAKLVETRKELSDALKDVDSTSNALAIAASAAEVGNDILSRLNRELASQNILAAELAYVEREKAEEDGKAELESKELKDQIMRCRRNAKEAQAQTLEAKQQALEAQASRHAAARAELVEEMREQHDREMQALRSQLEFEVAEAKAREEAKAKRDAELLARAEAACIDAQRAASGETDAARRTEAQIRHEMQVAKEEAERVAQAALAACREAQHAAAEEGAKAKRATVEIERSERREATIVKAKAEEVAQAEAARDLALAQVQASQKEVDAVRAQASQTRRSHLEMVTQAEATRDAAVAEAERARRAEAETQQDLVEARFLATVRSEAEKEELKRALARADEASAEMARAQFSAEGALRDVQDANRAAEEARKAVARAEARTRELAAELASCREAHRLAQQDAEEARRTVTGATAAELDARQMKAKAITERDQLGLELERLRVEEDERRRATEEARQRESEHAKRRESARSIEERQALSMEEARANKALAEATELREQRRIALIELEAARRAEEAAQRAERLIAQKLEADTEKIAEANVAKDAALAECERARRSEAEARREAEEAKQRDYNSRAAARHRDSAHSEELAAEVAKLRAAVQEAERCREARDMAVLEAEAARKAEGAARRAEAEAKERRLDAEARQDFKAKADSQTVAEAIAAREAAVALAARAQFAESEARREADEARREADEAKSQALNALKTAEEEQRLFKFESAKAREARREADEARKREEAAKAVALTANAAVGERDAARAEAARARREAEDAMRAVEEARRREATTDDKKEHALRLAQETLLYCSQWKADRIALLQPEHAIVPASALSLQSPVTPLPPTWLPPHSHPDTPPILARFCECFDCYDRHDAAHKQKRHQLFASFATSGGRISLPDACAGVKQALSRAYGQNANAMYRRYHRAVVYGFNDAKDTAIVRPGRDDDLVVTKSEFRLLMRFLCIYATWYEVFSRVVDRGSQAAMAMDSMQLHEDSRMLREEWTTGITGVREAGRTWAPFIALREASAADYDSMDASGGGHVILRDFCDWIEQTEKAAGTPYGLELGVNEDQHSSRALPNELRSPPPSDMLHGPASADRQQRGSTRIGHRHRSEGRLPRSRDSTVRESPRSDRSAWLHR